MSTFLGACYYSQKIHRSNELALALLFLADHGLGLGLQDHPHGLVEHVLEADLCKGAALHILALELLLDDFLGGFFHDGRFLRVLFLEGILVPQIDLISHEYFGGVPDDVLQFWVPLNQTHFTFFLALMNEDGSTTENTIRNTSQ